MGPVRPKRQRLSVFTDKPKYCAASVSERNTGNAWDTIGSSLAHLGNAGALCPAMSQEDKLDKTL